MTDKEFDEWKREQRQKAGQREGLARAAAATCNGALILSRQMAGAGSFELQSESERDEQSGRLEAARQLAIQAGKFTE